MTTPKNVVRKFPPFASFQKFLVSETSVGNISRQEVVSMIPPLLMDVKPGMTVLDLCAAPGSKAAQLIEMVHGGEEARTRKVIRRIKMDQGQERSPDGRFTEEQMEEEEQIGDWSDDGRTTGLLIANDADYKRSHMLIHQMKRLNSPNLIVTNHDATMFPSIKLPSGPTREDGGTRNKYLKFDRILADVPCSGDGTCRKNINVWKDWNPGNALGLFSTQVRILVRALQMLKVGGRVVYSTCSMNPVENEAVVATAIDRCGGMSKVDIIDCSSALPELRGRQGLSDWKVMDKQGRIWPSWQAVEEEKTQNGEEGLGRLSEFMFPSTKREEAFSLDRCMRVYGHLQDTGAFFIAVLEKKIEIKTRPEAEPRKAEPEPTSIMDVVNEIEAKTTNGSDPLEKIEAADKIVPPQTDEYAEGVSAAARQNKENAPSTSITAVKREHDAETDAAMATKRLKSRDGIEVGDPAPQGEEDRQVHWPPPPAAQLDASRPETQNSLPSPAPPLGNNTKQFNKNKQPFEEPFKYLDPDQPDLQSIYEFYDLSPKFPRDRFMVRNALGHPSKTIYYTSALARAILTANASSGIKFVHCGVKVFVKQDVQSAEVCRWRIQSEGLPVLEAWVGEKRVVRLWKRSTLRTLLVEMFPKVDGDGWKGLGEIGERVRDVGMGCCVLRIEKGEGEDSFRWDHGPFFFPSKTHSVTLADFHPRSERMVLPLWRSLHSLNLMLPKEDRRAMLLRLYNEDTPLMDHSKDRFHNNSKPQSSADGKDEPDVVKDEPDAIKDEEEAVDADLNDEMAGKGEGDDGNTAAAATGKDVEMEIEENGAGDEEIDDDVRPDALKEEVDDGI